MFETKRVPKREVVAFRLPPDEVTWIREEAKRRTMSQTNLVRLALKNLRNHK